MEGELARSEVSEMKHVPLENYKSIKPEKEMSPKELMNAVNYEFGKAEKEFVESKTSDVFEINKLSDNERKQIREETGWSNKIIDYIETMDQYKIYKEAELHEVELDGRLCLVKNIDMDYVDPKTGMTNRELMELGRSPIDSKTGEKIELHHMGQSYDAPLAELCENSEHGDGNHGVLHTKEGESWRNNSSLSNHYDNVDKPNHWKEHAKEV